MSQNNILDDDFSIDNFELARKGARLVNFIIDKIGFYVLFILHVFILDGSLGIIPEDGSPLLGVYFFFIYVMYHAVFEHFFRKTPGKFITSTVVVKNDGGDLSFSNILLRNVGRLIPFDAISFLFTKQGWHDQISSTMVVYEDFKK